MKDSNSKYTNDDGLSPIIGNSVAIREIRETINQVAPSEASVLIDGESGTGKELVAVEIHRHSRRWNQKFVPVNIAAIPHDLVESSLFGHVKGSFTGAHQERKGFCETADGGTLFLDEISEMPVDLQAKLLRFLQEGTIQRVGSDDAQRVNVRIVAATNQNPEQGVADGVFREDLFYRLNVVPIYVPPLRDRPSDIPPLLSHFLRLACERNRMPMKQISDAAVDYLVSQDWPGNVRQLENTVERLVVMTVGPVIDDPSVTISRRNGHAVSHANVGDFEPGVGLDLTSMDRVQRQAIINALTQTGDNVVEAARLLGLGQATVYRKIKAFRIPRNGKRQVLDSVSQIGDQDIKLSASRR